MPISPQKQSELQERMGKLGIKEEDLIEKFILGSGSGGQKINKTSSCVYLKHQPTGIEVKCQKDRSREMNRFLARRHLCEIIEKEILHEKSAKDAELAKIRKQKKRRSRKTQQKLFEEKKQLSEKKQFRRSPSVESNEK